MLSFLGLGAGSDTGVNQQNSWKDLARAAGNALSSAKTLPCLLKKQTKLGVGKIDFVLPHVTGKGMRLADPSHGAIGSRWLQWSSCG